MVYKYENFTLDDEFLSNFGSTWLIDSVYVFLVVPIGLVGFSLNFLSIHVITKIEKKNPIFYKYLKMLCLNSSNISLSTVFAAYVFTTRYIGFKTDMFARISKCILINYLGTSLYFFGNIIDIILTLERVAMFKPKLGAFKKINPLILMQMFLFLSLIINLPTLFRYYVKTDEQILLDINLSIQNKSLNFDLCGHWYFYDNYIINSINIFLRDMLTLFIELIFGYMSLHEYRKFKSRKLRMTTTNMSREEKRKNRDDSNLTLMSIYLLFISIWVHITFTSAYILLQFPALSTITFLVVCINFLFGTIKYALNFFVFFYFNSSFRRAFKNTLRIKNKTEVTIFTKSQSLIRS